MFLGSPLPLSPDVPLTTLLSCARLDGPVGAWVRPCVRALRIYRLSLRDHRFVLGSSDLGFLLARCKYVAVRGSEGLVVLGAETVIQWRALQVATGTPHLPGLSRLQTMLPGLRVTSSGFLVPVGEDSPEEVLALCLEEGMRVSGSRIVYDGKSLP